MCLGKASFTLPDDGRCISQNIASLNILAHDVINVKYYEHWTEKQKKVEYVICMAYFCILATS